MRMPTRRLQPVTATGSRSHLQPGNPTLAHIASRWPRLFHLTDAGGWEAIREHGLLSTTALLDRFGITGPDRDAIESMRRPQSVQISHAAYGRAWIHDNKPVNAGALRRTLVGMSEEDWYRELSRRVFFWLTENRLDRHPNAQLNRDRRYDILVLDTAGLLGVYGDRIELAHLNTGAVYHSPSSLAAQAPSAVSRTTPGSNGSARHHESRSSS